MKTVGGIYCGGIYIVDELRSALALATDEELEELTTVLFARRFNPLDYLYLPNPHAVQSQDRESCLDSIEKRFRFLAADGLTVLRGKTDQLPYRQILIQVCRFLKLPASDELSAPDLEAEIFLHLLNRTWQDIPGYQRQLITQRVQSSLLEAKVTEQLPLVLQKDPVGLVLKGGGAIAISTLLRSAVLQHISRQFIYHFASYQAAQQVVRQGTAALATQMQGQVLLHSAREGMALTAARYSVVRGVFSFLGPALWTWFVADLGWRAISVNYARVIPTVFALAQIRLTRSECFELA